MQAHGTGRQPDPSKRATTDCPACGKSFTYYRSWPRKFCSNVCKGKARISNIKGWVPSSFTATCEQCGAEYTTTPKKTRGRFCNLKCYGRWMSENVVGEAHPKHGKTGPTGPRHPYTPVTCSVCSLVFEVKPSQAPRRVCCSEACIAVYHSQTGRYAGANNPGWTGGNYAKYYGPSWRPAARAARARDKVCQDCGVAPSTNRKSLDVHHIVPFRTFGVDRHKEANRLDNLVSLCQTCHTAREWATNRRVPAVHA